MEETFLKLLFIPFILIFQITEIIENPNRDSLIGSQFEIIQQNYSWNYLKELASDRYEFGAALADDSIYLVGGLTGPTVYLPTNKVQVFNLKTAEWKEVKSAPVIVHHPGVTSDGEKIYLIGGNGIRIIPYSYAYSYNPKQDKWDRLKDMPTKRGALGLTYLDGKVYAIGGAANKIAKNDNEVYNIKSKNWDKLKPMPTAREHLALVAAGRKIYALGGYNGTRFHSLKTFEVYDPNKDEWSKLKDLPLPISGFAAAAEEDSIFIFGGEQGWAASGEVHQYIISQNRWVRRPDLPSPRYASVAVKADDGIHVFGGNEIVGGYKFLKDHLLFTLSKE